MVYNLKSKEKIVTELIVNGKNVLEVVNLQKNKEEILIQRANIPSSVSLNHFKEKGIVFKANVKGEDLNDLVRKLQHCFIETNKREITIYNELDTIFNTIESIHKGSIEGTIVAVKSAQEAIDNAAYAIEQIEGTLIVLSKFKQRLEENTEHLNDIDIIWDVTQRLNKDYYIIKKEIDKITAKLNEEIKILRIFKEDIEKYENIKNIDKMFEDLKSLSCEVNYNEKKYNASLKTLEEKLKGIFTNQQLSVASNTKDIKELQNYKDFLSKIKYLHEVDSIWKKSESHQGLISQLEKAIEKSKNDIVLNTKDIYELHDYKTYLDNIIHLRDVDKIWEKTELHSIRIEELKKQDITIQNLLKTNEIRIADLTKHREELDGIKHLSDVDSIWKKTEFHSDILEKVKKQDIVNQELLKDNKMSILNLDNYKKTLETIEHLKDIDHIWNLTESHSGQLLDIEKQNLEIKKIVQINKEDTEANILNVIEKMDESIRILTKKFKITYWIAIGAIGCSLLQLILIILKGN